MSSNLIVVAWVLGLSAGALFQKPAQETPPKPVPAEQAQPPAQSAPSPMIPVASLRGAEIVFEGAPPGKNDPAAGKDAANAPKAKVADLILTTRDGRLAYAVVSVSGGTGGKDKTVLVPAADMKFAVMDDKPTASARMTPVQIQGAPAFDIDKAKKDGVEAALNEGKSAPGEASAPKPKGEKGEKGEPKGEKGGKAEGSPSAEAAPKYALSSQMGSWGLQASDKPFGTVKDGALDPEKSTVAYLFAAPNGGGDAIIVPFAACSCARTDKDMILKVGKTTEQLGSAPKYEKPAKGLLSVEQMKRAEEFFGTRGAVGSQG
jgi:hypothetical protein